LREKIKGNPLCRWRKLSSLRYTQKDRHECLSTKHGIAPPEKRWGEVARAGKHQQLFLEAVLKFTDELLRISVLDSSLADRSK
jgi:hypothetical protein